MMALPVDVVRKVLAEGRLVPGVPLPPYPDGTKVEFHFRTLLGVGVDGEGGEGEVLDDTRSMGRPMTLILGKQFKLPLWELILHTMIPGQVAQFHVPPHHTPSYPMVSKAVRETASGARIHAHHCCGMMSQGIGYPDLDKLMEKPEPLTFVFELMNVTPPGSYEPESWQLTESEKLESLPLLKSQGNDLFAGGNIEGAEAKYFEALARIEQLLLREHPSSEEARTLEAHKVPLLLNYALCLMRKRDFYQAITHLDTALGLQPENVKGLFRRGKCQQAVGNYREARSDYGAALRLDPSLEVEGARLEQEMVAEEKRRDQMDRDRYKRAFIPEQLGDGPAPEVEGSEEEAAH